MSKTCRFLIAATMFGVATVPAQQEPAALPPGLSAALALEQHFQSLAAKSYQTVVTVTGYQKKVAQPVMLLTPSPEAPATNPVDELQEEGWAAATDEDLYPGYQPLGVASGFVVQAEGEILTCLHALQKPDGSFADLIDVQTHDLRHTICELSAAEPTLNIALLRMVTLSPNRATPN